MNDDRIGNILPPPPAGKSRRDREFSAIQPFLQLRYFRRRGRVVSRIVAIDTKVRDEPATLPIDLYFALG